MAKFWKTFRYFALAGAPLSFTGCGIVDWGSFLSSAVTTSALEFLLDNNGIFDLFTDN